MIENIKRVTKVTGKKDAMRTNYMMTVDDVMEELGVKRSMDRLQLTGQIF